MSDTPPTLLKLHTWPENCSVTSSPSITNLFAVDKKALTVSLSYTLAEIISR
ncbi:hypothetical protein [Arsenophonus nasoniae]|uniref:hypothetical protein n=1 Tax=Arsenophonus nasoniae TaxID=638 RepID=UPI003878F7B7